MPSPSTVNSSYQHEETPLLARAMDIPDRKPKRSVFSCGVGVYTFSAIAVTMFLAVTMGLGYTVGPGSVKSLFWDDEEDDIDLLNLPNDWFCLDDDHCASGHCCKNIFPRRCSECCDNSDCNKDMEPQPPIAGTYGTPTCVKDTRTCSAFRNGESSLIPTDGYPIWVPIEDETDFAKVVIPRNVMEGDDPVSEQVWYFDLKEQPVEDLLSQVEFDGTYVKIPMYTQLQSGYSRVYSMYNETETGIMTSVYLPNDISVVTDKPNAGMAEKVHALTYTSEYSTARGEYFRQRNQQELQENPNFDLRRYAGRMDALAVVWGELNSITTQLEAGIDKAHLWQIRRYSGDPSVQKTIDPTQTPGWSHHADLAKQAIALAKNSTFMEKERVHKSENHCRHFEQDTGVGYNDTHIFLPVGKPLTMVSGEMAFSPMYFLGLNGGYTTVHYDEENKILQMYYRAHQQFRGYTDVEHQTDNTKPSGIWLSSMDSGKEEFYVDPQVDGRTDQLVSLQKPTSSIGKVLQSMAALLGIREDTAIWARPMSETCDQKYVNSTKWEEAWEAIRLANDGEDIMDELFLSGVTIAISNRGAPCGGIYLRNDYGNDTHAYGFNEFGVWNHMLLEVKQGHTRVLSTANWWDDWECFYQEKDLGMCQV